MKEIKYNELKELNQREERLKNTNVLAIKQKYEDLRESGYGKSLNESGKITIKNSNNEKLRSIKEWYESINEINDDINNIPISEELDVEDIKAVQNVEDILQDITILGKGVCYTENNLNNCIIFSETLELLNEAKLISYKNPKPFSNLDLGIFTIEDLIKKFCGILDIRVFIDKDEFTIDEAVKEIIITLTPFDR